MGFKKFVFLRRFQKFKLIFVTNAPTKKIFIKKTGFWRK
jgi:hypothetical protein